MESNRVALLGAGALASFVYLTRRFYFDGPWCNDRTTKLNGKTVIITGANTGIGKETALDLAGRGARVILACRDMPKAEEAAKYIRSQTGNGNVHVDKLDLSSFDSIRQFCAKINEREDRIDILINNAGIMMCPKWTTKDGFEMQFGTNHLGHFLLTNLLLDKIRKSGAARIINVSSRAYLRNQLCYSRRFFLLFRLLFLMNFFPYVLQRT